MLKVLIVEDNIILADILEDVLFYNGHEVCGTAGTVDAAVVLADYHSPDVAVLDFRLGNRCYGSDIPPKLRDKNHPAILYVSADNLGNILTRADGEAYIQKPYKIDDLLAAIQIVHAIKTNNTSCPVSFPKNFHLLEDSAEPFRKSA
jgi:DNA-binding response OmpR family regulator